MYYIVESEKSFEQASIDLEAAVKRHQFGVLHVHDLGSTLRSKGVAFGDDACPVYGSDNSSMSSSHTTPWTGGLGVVAQAARMNSSAERMGTS